jgi:hypothetical protein
VKHTSERANGLDDNFTNLGKLLSLTTRLDSLQRSGWRSIVIRFACPKCGKLLKVTEDRAGLPLFCRCCGDQCVAPAVDSAAAATQSDKPVERSPTQPPQQRRRPFFGLSRRVGWVVGLVAAVGVLSLVLHIVGDLPEALAPWPLPVAVSSLILLLAMLHGNATGCPACGRWWARTQIEKVLVDRETCDEDGAPATTTVSRSTYECGGCGHRWSVMDSGVEPKSAHAPSQRHQD